MSAGTDSMARNSAARACVIGWPIAHSRSPLIHTYWLKALGIDGGYDSLAVEPGTLGDFASLLRSGRYVGANVTLPHKQEILAHADHVAAVARRLGAANTLYMADGKLHATSTDGEGFMAHLHASAPGLDLSAAPVAVLGAGGAARAIVASLADAGAGSIRIVNRTRAKAETLAQELGGGGSGAIEIVDWGDWGRALADAALVVNTTSLGMTGKPPLEIDLGPLPREASVYDIVYAPLQTDLLKQAGARGNRAIDGLGMLLHQAVPGFEKWFGMRPQVTEDLRRLVAADLEAGR